MIKRCVIVMLAVAVLQSRESGRAQETNHAGPVNSYAPLGTNAGWDRVTNAHSTAFAPGNRALMHRLGPLDSYGPLGTNAASSSVTDANSVILTATNRAAQNQAAPLDFLTAPGTNTRSDADTDDAALVLADTNRNFLAATGMTMDSLDDHQRLGPGDRVMYQVIEDQDLPRSLTVTDSGDLVTPYFGLVHAAGKTCRQLAREIKGSLEKNLYYQATVILALEVVNKAWMTGKVYVTGQVRQPGGFDIPAAENLTVSKAILNAGGFSDFSDKKHVRLIRKTADGEKTYVVNVVDVWNGKLAQDLAVQSGDMVVVPARLVNY